MDSRCHIHRAPLCPATKGGVDAFRLFWSPFYVRQKEKKRKWKNEKNKLRLREGGRDERKRKIEKQTLNGTSGVLLRQRNPASTYSGKEYWIKNKINIPNVWENRPSLLLPLAPFFHWSTCGNQSLFTSGIHKLESKGESSFGFGVEFRDQEAANSDSAGGAAGQWIKHDFAPQGERTNPSVFFLSWSSFQTFPLWKAGVCGGSFYCLHWNPLLCVNWNLNVN